MNTTLWIVAIVLAVAFLASGALKVVRSREQLAASGMGWAQDFSPGVVKLIGLLEVLAAIGLILPAAFGVVPVLVPLAAAGLALLMAGALITHLRRHESQPLVVNIVLIALTCFVAWGRFGPHSFTN